MTTQTLSENFEGFSLILKEYIQYHQFKNMKNPLPKKTFALGKNEKVHETVLLDLMGPRSIF